MNSSGHDPEVLEYAFGTSGGTDDRISRVNQFKFNLTSSTKTSMVNYAFVGVGRTILVDLDQPDVQLDFTLSLDGKRRTVGYTTQTQGFYPGFDQFGRLALQTWADGGLTSASSLPTKPQIVALQYGYDDRGNRTAVLDVRRGNLWNRSHTYTNDGLDRLKKARRNTWANLISGSPVDGVGTQSWDLDLLGNWNEFQSWAPGSPPAPETETRTHNAVNELLTRTLPNSGPEHTLGYDAAGNMATDAVTSGNTTIYTHDAWNRLVKVEVDDGTTVVTKLEQEFNGLTWRTLKREDTPGSGAGLDEERTYAYNASWQLVEERVDADYSGDPGLDKRVQYAWGLRYIDDCLMHRADLNNDGDYADSGENTWYHMTDGMFSSVAVLNRIATLVERVSYDSYGQARHHRPGDVDANGNSGSADSILIGDIIVAHGGSSVPISSALYRAEADLNRDGTLSSADRTIAGVSASALQSGLISIASARGPDNAIGWDGYVFNPATGDYLVRHRTYIPPLGRWAERDPSGYVDGFNLEEFGRSNPLARSDPRGLQSSAPGGQSIDTGPCNDTCKRAYDPKIDPQGYANCMVGCVNGQRGANCFVYCLRFPDPVENANCLAGCNAGQGRQGGGCVVTCTRQGSIVAPHMAGACMLVAVKNPAKITPLGVAVSGTLGLVACGCMIYAIVHSEEIVRNIPRVAPAAPPMAPGGDRGDSRATKHCKFLYELCYMNQNQPSPNPDFGQQKPCFDCYRTCMLTGGVWPFMKCPIIMPPNYVPGTR
ncbi:MAG: hypothetical protein KF724_13595 [Phycisphaeraceae bacterium]|nr:hypothetical protein [Phycisphaeraceae bacterium]